MKTYKLLNNKSRVPVDINVFKNKNKFEISLLKIIDTSVVYEQFDTRYNILTRLDNHMENSFYDIYRFYSNGCFNNFFVDRELLLEKKMFDPTYTGYRGVYYVEKGEIRFDLFAETDQRQHIGKLTGKLTFKGDTMYIKRDDLNYMEIYIKRKLPPEFFTYKANW